MLLKNKIILITGSALGIGREVAKYYSSLGATIILLDKSLTNLNSIYDEIVHAKYPTPAIYPLNLATATPKDYDDLLHSINEKFGKLDAVLYNAAMLGELAPIEHVEINSWYEVMQVNLNSTFLLTKALLPLLRQNSKAKIIFTLDKIANSARAYWGAYAISKNALAMFSKILAQELENISNITVHTITPPAVATALRKKAFPAEDITKLAKTTDLLSEYLEAIK